MTIVYGLIGLDQLKAALNQLPDDLRNRALSPAMKAGPQVTADRAKALCPVSVDQVYDNQPGALRDAIVVRPKRRAKVRGELVWYVISRPPLTSRGPSKRVPLDYGYWVEYGHLTRAGGKAAKKGLGFMERAAMSYVPPHPYMRPAFLSTIGTASQAIIDSVRAYVAKWNAKNLRGGR